MYISVIIPMYNSEKSILNTLNSVIIQGYKFFEIIIVNDGSTDSSKEIVNDFIFKNPNLNTKLINQGNKGVSSARNVGLKASSGTWIALLDSDDEWLPNKIDEQLKIISENPLIDFIGTSRNGKQMHNIFYKKLRYLSEISPKQLLYKMYFITPTVMFKKSILNEVGYFDEHQKFCEDGNYYIRICELKKCFLLNEPLVNTGQGKAHFGEKGLSSNLYQMYKGELINLNYSLNRKIISHFEYYFIYCFYMLKFFRRVLLSIVYNIK